MTLKGLWAATKLRPNGRPYWYVRRTGRPNFALPDLPTDDPAFLRAYATAWAIPDPGQEKAAQGGMAKIITEALTSRRYKGMSPAYRAALRREWEAMRRAYGHLALRGLQERHVRQDVDRSSNPPSRLRAWRFLDIPAARAVKVRMAKTSGHEPWTADEIEAFRARWPIGSAPRAGMELLLWTACRISDAVRIGRGNLGDDGIVAYRQKKTSGFAYVPWTNRLPDYASAWERDRQMMHDALASFSGHVTFFPTTTGRGRSDKALGTMMSDAAEAAGVAKTAHGLRKSRAKMLAEAGASTHQIAAWTGHATLKEVEHYTREASRRSAVENQSQGGLRTKKKR